MQFGQPRADPRNINPTESHNLEFDVQDEFEPLGNEVVYLRKLYFLMFLQFVAAIVINLMQYEQLQDTLRHPHYLVYILGSTLILLSLLSRLDVFESIPLNALIYIGFIVVLTFFFVALTTKTNIEQSAMAQFMLGGQIFAQMMSVFQVRIELQFHQQSLYVLAAGLVVFQLFIIYTSVPFYEMVITLICGILFGFLLVYGSLNELKTATHNALTGSVRSYSDVTGVFFLINYLISAIFKLRRTMPRG